MTYKQEILNLLEASEMIHDSDHAMSCQEICKQLIIARSLVGNRARYLSGSISTILAKMVKDKILEYDERKTERGGHLYKLPDTYFDLELKEGQMVTIINKDDENGLYGETLKIVGKSKPDGMPIFYTIEKNGQNYVYIRSELKSR